jgi:hypothetical protein
VDAPAPADDAGGRRRRGLILAAIVLAVGVPATSYAWLSDRNADRAASALAQDVRIAGRLVDDVADLWARETTSWYGDDASAIDEALGHGDARTGAVFDDGALSVAYEVRWGLAPRCVLLLVRDDEVRTAVLDTASCTPPLP